MKTHADDLRLLLNGVGLIGLMVVFSLALQFPAVLICRLLCSKEMISDLMFGGHTPLLAWHDELMRKWIDLLWGRASK